MSQDVVLIISEDIQNLQLQGFLSKHWNVDQYILRDGIVELQVHQIDGGSNFHCYVSIIEMIPMNAVAGDYEDHEMLTQELAAALGSSRYYHVVFNNREFYDAVLFVMLNGIADRIDRCWIDDSYGGLIWGKEALTKLQDSR